MAFSSVQAYVIQFKECPKKTLMIFRKDWKLFLKLLLNSKMSLYPHHLKKKLTVKVI